MKNLGRKDLELLWADLAGEDARTAHAAVWTLAATPEAVPFLKDRLQPAREVPPERMRQLLTDLDSATFAIREAASKELERLGDRAKPALRKALQENPSAEVRKRVETLLARPRIVRSSETLRSLRAIQVLERIGSSDAQQVLQKMTKGAPRARETQEAKASLERLADRPAAAP